MKILLYYEPTTSLFAAGAPGPPGRPAIVSVNSGARSPRAGNALNASSLSGTGGMCGCSQETVLSLANQIRDVIPSGPPGKAGRESCRTHASSAKTIRCVRICTLAFEDPEATSARAVPREKQALGEGLDPADQTEMWVPRESGDQRGRQELRGRLGRRGIRDKTGFRGRGAPLVSRALRARLGSLHLTT